LAIAQQAEAAGIVVGPLCLDGVKETRHPDQQTTTDTGVWTPADYQLSGPQLQSHIVVFDAPIRESETLETCTQIIARMATGGSRPIVSGVLKQFELRAMIFSGGGQHRIQIDPNALKANLGHVDSGARPVAGGH
jgi:hypothetical protein